MSPAEVPDLFASLSIRSDPISFRTIANGLALNAATVQRGWNSCRMYNSSEANLAQQFLSLLPRLLMEHLEGPMNRPPNPLPDTVTEQACFPTCNC